MIDSAADLVAERIDLDKLRSVARVRKTPVRAAAAARVTPPGQRIALAKDAAFSFLYPHLLESWRQACHLHGIVDLALGFASRRLARSWYSTHVCARDGR